MDRTRRCRAPIRYGRESGGRDKTYTMVFSRLVQRRDYGMGTALFVPCRLDVSAIDDLLDEARHLWAAETSDGDGRGRIGQSWGRVAALFRDETHPMRREWAKAVEAIHFDPMESTSSEGATVRESGLLRIAWPEWVDRPGAEEPDVLLATATRPTLTHRRYPRAGLIAGRWLDKRSGEERYFFNNVRAGIRTFQDGTIWKTLATSGKAQDYADLYPEAVDILAREGGRSA